MSAANDSPIVAVGAAAGGLAAFRSLLGHVGADTGIAWILVHRPDPGADGDAPELRDRPELGERVVAIEDGMRPQPGRVHVVPPNRYATLQDGHLRLTSPTDSGRPRLAIDHLMRSLADERGETAVGVVLSGTGTDGTAGLRAIRARGGLAIAQQPDEAEHTGMPRSAIDTGIADLVVPLAAIPDSVNEFLARNGRAAPVVLGTDGAPADTREPGPSDGLAPILDLLRERSRFDGALYKTSTVARRVRRRMGLRRIDALDDYVALLRDDRQELEQLLRDLLISVTEFFRDPDVFAFFRDHVAPGLLDRTDGEVVRVWVPGCASGEEAYSIAICLLEAAETAGRQIELQIFATDVDRNALDAGRQAVYPLSSLDQVSPERRARFFQDVDAQRVRVSRRLRDAVSFAQHDVLRDPPFSRLDLVSCRNLMIYLTEAAQTRLLGLFQFGLRRDGILVLGTAERPPGSQAAFAAIDKRLRIYRRTADSRRGAARLPSMLEFPGDRDVAPPPPTRREPSLHEVASRVLLDACAVPGLVIDRDGTVLYLHGPIGRFLNLPRGEMRPDLFEMLRPELSSRMRAALYRSTRSRSESVFDWNDPEVGADGTGAVRVRINPASLRDADGLYAVVFESDGAPRPALTTRGTADEAALVSHLERELEATREDLRTTLEELESSNEELRSSNEETMSINEELQSSNEELEASTQELRSLNEELSTVNQELRDKIAEVQSAHDDLANVIKSTRVATLFLDPELSLVRFTPAAAGLLGLAIRDTGQGPGEFLQDLDPNFEADARRVLEDLRTAERQLQHPDGRCFQRRILPYRTEDDRISGVVATFTDVTNLTRAAEQLAARARRQAATTRLGLEALDEDTSLEMLLHRTPALVAETLDVPLVKLLELLPGKSELRLVSGVGWTPGLVGNAVVPATPESQAGYTLHANQAVVVEDLATDHRLSGPALLHDHGVRSGVSCVIHGRDAPWGVIGAHSPEAGSFGDDDVLFVQGIANVLSNAVQRAQATRNLQDSERRLTLAKDAAGIGIFDFDLHSGRIRWDPRVHELWGVPEQERVDLEVFLAGLHPDDRGSALAALERAKDPDGDGRFQAEYRVRPRSDIHYRWVVATGQMFFEHRSPVRLVGTVQDVTARKRVEQSLLDQNRRLEREDRRKQEFLATLGHELRNPLAALDGAVRVLESGLKPAGEMSRLMAGHVHNLSRLVDDLLDLSRISSGRVRLRKQTVDLAEVSAAALDAVRLRAEEKRQELDVHAATPVLVDGDPTRLLQIVANLLVNACDYSDPDTTIQLRVVGDGDQARVEVHDEGRGLTAEQLESVFQPFTQVTPGGGGLGIGLPLVDGLARLHGGSVTATSPGLGFGSTFIVSLPRIATVADTPEAEGAERASSRDRTMRILVIDDLRDAADMLALLLKSNGIDARAAHGGADGVAAALEWKPDVALVDLGMPEVDGFEVARRLQAELGDAAPLLLAATGFGDPDTETRVLQAGFQARLLKPVDPDRLLERIERMLAERDHPTRPG